MTPALKCKVGYSTYGHVFGSEDSTVLQSNTGHCERCITQGGVLQPVWFVLNAREE